MVDQEYLPRENVLDFSEPQVPVIERTVSPEDQYRLEILALKVENHNLKRAQVMLQLDQIAASINAEKVALEAEYQDKYGYGLDEALARRAG